MLALDVVGDVEQHAAGGGPVASGAPGLLQVILERAGDVGVDDQPHVGLVDAHAEGVGRGDDAQRAGNEGLLGFLLGLRWQLGVVRRGGQPLVAEKARELFGLLARGAVGDGAAADLRRQVLLDQAGHLLELFRHGGLDDVELEVLALRAAVQRAHLDAQLLAEMADDVGDDFRLGGCRQTLDQGQVTARCILRRLADEAGDVAVVRAKVLPPLRQAVRFVENPGADFALRQHLAHAAIAQLFRGDEQDADVAQPHAFEHVGTLGHRQQPVDRRATVDAAFVQALDLILHQRHQRRNDDRQGAGTDKARQGGNLVAQRLAGAGRQNAEAVIAAHRALDDDLLQWQPGFFIDRLGTERVGLAEPLFQLLE